MQLCFIIQAFNVLVVDQWMVLCTMYSAKISGLGFKITKAKTELMTS